jgi:hypothetical protein
MIQFSVQGRPSATAEPSPRMRGHPATKWHTDRPPIDAILSQEKITPYTIAISTPDSKSRAIAC